MKNALQQKIQAMRDMGDKPTTESSDMQEAAMEGEAPDVEGVENQINDVLDQADKSGALSVLEPHVAASGCKDTKDLMRKAQALPETRGKPPEELASMLSSDPALAQKIGGGVGGEDAKKPMSYKDKINAMREAEVEGG